MLANIAAALLVILACGAAVLFVRAWLFCLRAQKLHKQALARWRRIRHDYVASKLERNTYARGAKSRDGEMKWYALKWEGEFERANQYEAEANRLEAQYVDTGGKPVKRDKTRIQIERDTRYGE